MENLDFMIKFKPKSRCIIEFKYWIVCLREKASTLGDAVILLKRQVSSASEVNEEESIEYSKVIKWYENFCKEKFGANKFNYLMLMMKDNYVHYHAFPRYDKNINMFGKLWTDQDYPGAIDVKKCEKIDDNILNRIVDFMKS